MRLPKKMIQMLLIVKINQKNKLRQISLKMKLMGLSTAFTMKMAVSIPILLSLPQSASILNVIAKNLLLIRNHVRHQLKLQKVRKTRAKVLSKSLY